MNEWLLSQVGDSHKSSKQKFELFLAGATNALRRIPCGESCGIFILGWNLV